MRIMLFLNISFPITNAETEEINAEQACEPVGLTGKQTQVGIPLLTRSLHASTLTGGS